MHELASLDGEITRSDVAGIDARTSAALYGKGVFTTLAIKSGKAFLWEKHWRRLDRDSKRLKIETGPLSEERVRAALNRLLERNAVETGRARITLLDASPTRLWPYRSTGKTRVLIVTGPPQDPLPSYRLGISSQLVNSTSPLAGVKSCNYLEHLMVFDEAKARGFDEAVRLNERGEVTSASMANLFWMKNGELFTPGLSTGCLAGTTREFVMENLPCAEIAGGIDRLMEADAVFLTSAGLGVAAVSEIEGRKFVVSEYQITKLIRDGKKTS